MLSPAQLVARAGALAPHVTIEQADREAMAFGLYFQGYPAGRACQIAFVELEDNDGALQMLARHRLAALSRERRS